jgi:YidC/Oxa1 family membrane protein insertase
MDNRRLILFLVFSFSLIMLWDGWQKQNRPLPLPGETATGQVPAAAVPVPTGATGGGTGVIPGGGAGDLANVATTTVETDLYVAEISARGGDIIRLALKHHPDTEDKNRNFVLLDNGGKHVYLAQSGVIGEGLPNHRSLWRMVGNEHQLKAGENNLKVSLESDSADGRKIVKTYIFHRGSYQIDVLQEGLPAKAYAYYQFTRDGKPAEGHSNPMMMGVATFTGPAVFTEADKFQKVSFTDIAKNKAKFASKADNGWLAMVQHYFVGAWLPPPGVAREFYMRSVGDNLYSTGVICLLAPTARAQFRCTPGHRR